MQMTKVLGDIVERHDVLEPLVQQGTLDRHIGLCGDADRDAQVALVAGGDIVGLQQPDV